MKLRDIEDGGGRGLCGEKAWVSIWVSRQIRWCRITITGDEDPKRKKEKRSCEQGIEEEGKARRGRYILLRIHDDESLSYLKLVEKERWGGRKNIGVAVKS